MYAKNKRRRVISTGVPYGKVPPEFNRSWVFGRVYMDGVQDLPIGPEARFWWRLFTLMDDTNKVYMTVADEARRMDCARFTIYRYLHRLEARGLVTRFPYGVWMLSPRHVYSGHFDELKARIEEFDKLRKSRAPETPNEPCDLQTGSPDADAPAGDSDALAEGGSRPHC